MPVGSCTRQSNAESAEHSPPSQMQRYKVIPPTNRIAIILYNFRPVLWKTPPTTNMGTTWVKTTRLPQPTIRYIKDHYYHSTLFFPSKTVHIEGNGRRAYLLACPWSQTAHGSANCRIRLSSSRAPSTPSRAHLGALLVTRERCRSYPGVQCELRRRRRDTCIRALSRMRTTFRVNADWCPS
ncbi:hypothetical protein BGY98DRAFT_998403 [Russula aff. rugulosa BPL654]|nr:hypothetical protein BGY98DRAFT_998403 [Russula aff. rugulosa BPL654]